MGQGGYIFGSEGLAVSDAERGFFAEADPWGFILFARNVDTPDQLRRLTGGLRDAVGREAPVLIDQEGGRVQRMRSPHWREWLPPLEQVALAGERAERAMWLRYRLIAEELRAVGIDVNCAPCADIAGPQTHDVLRNRCYAGEAGRVAALARAVAEGLMAGGVAAGHEAHAGAWPGFGRQPSRPAAHRCPPRRAGGRGFRAVQGARRSADGNVGPYRV